MMMMELELEIICNFEDTVVVNIILLLNTCNYINVKIQYKSIAYISYFTTIISIPLFLLVLIQMTVDSVFSLYPSPASYSFPSYSVLFNTIYLYRFTTDSSSY
jgi:hypothetical protein